MEHGAPESPKPRPAASPREFDSVDGRRLGLAMSETDLMVCVNEVNRHRTAAGRTVLVRSSVLEAFADEAARVDYRARTPHRHFRRTAPKEPRAENEIPWWPLESFRSVADVIQQGIAMFRDEGPGGGHYENMLGGWREIGCGGVISHGVITVTIEFR